MNFHQRLDCREFREAGGHTGPHPTVGVGVLVRDCRSALCPPVAYVIPDDFLEYPMMPDSKWQTLMMIDTVGQADRWHPLIDFLFRKFLVMKLNFAERDVGVKTEFCPDVAGFCPGVSGILSSSGRGVSWFALNIGRRTFRIGSECSGGNGVKSGGGSGGCGALVVTVPVGVDPPRARARGEVAYDSGGVDQGESVQQGVREVQWRGFQVGWEVELFSKGEVLRSVRDFVLTVSCSLRSARIAFGLTRCVRSGMALAT
ncbi:MAG: hypothetical protein CME32_20185 [Gimesia sp.]|nr:hypothetical protein [Gimesia sp.]